MYSMYSLYINCIGKTCIIYKAVSSETIHTLHVFSVRFDIQQLAHV